MKKNLITLVVLLFICYFGSAQSISGVYDTDFQEMTLSQNGDVVTGTYEYDNGRIEGTLNGSTLSGTWSQDRGKGKFVFVFDVHFLSFKGKWGQNDNLPTNKWNGKKIRPSQIDLRDYPANINGIYDTDFGEMTLHQNCDVVFGTYKHLNGQIRGTLNGNMLIGKWSQDNGSGNFDFVFSIDFSGFTGKWGYNDAEPTSKWNGTKIREEEPLKIKLKGRFNTTYGEMTFYQSLNCNIVKASYQNGRIEGTLNGSTLSGSWFQDNGKGKFVFGFNPDFTEFKGKWGDNDTYPTNKWDGIKAGF